MKNEDKIILDGVISVFGIENNGRIYPKTAFDKYKEILEQRMKQNNRIKKLKKILADDNIIPNNI